MSEPFIWPVRVYFEDTDAGGVVYYANYLKFYERARTEWLRLLGIGQEVLKNEYNILFVVRNVSVEYRRPAVLDDHLQVMTKVAWMKGASLEFEQSVWRGDTLLSSARSTIVCIDKDKMKPVPVPQVVYEKMRAGIESG